jgi:hypothetical protein
MTHRSRPVYWCAECDQQITGDVYRWSDDAREYCEYCFTPRTSPDLADQSS